MLQNMKLKLSLVPLGQVAGRNKYNIKRFKLCVFHQYPIFSFLCLFDFADILPDIFSGPCWCRGSPMLHTRSATRKMLPAAIFHLWTF